MERRKKAVLIWASVIILVIGYGTWKVATKPKQAPPTSVATIHAQKGIPVTAEKARRGPWEHWISLYGTVESSKVVQISADRQEYVLAVLCDVGDLLSPGDAMAILDTREIKEKYEAQRAKVRELLDNYRRLQSLKKAGGASAQEVESALSAYLDGEAKLKELEIDLDRSKVSSPIEGIVMEKFVEPGDLASPGKVLFKVADLDSLEVHLVASPKDALKLANAHAARVNTPKGWIDASVKRVDPVADAQTGLLKVILEVPSESGLRPGETVEGQLKDENVAEAIYVPYEAIQRPDEGKAAVFVVSGDVAVQKEVVLGESFNGYVRIISGLDGDEKVVVRGSDRLYPNAKIWLQGE
ncbi:efflux RND transporter periplasmic adaptor subunit [Thermovirga lienii]|uniref:efflux RND transporter periplasmic adaptor subunit n=1 Tax=Thermovirga lienii TaxID=336261 RepID=UPI000EE3CB19|nr:hypothetical protein [Thermovirga lienii]